MTSSAAPKRFIYDDHDMEAFSNSTAKAELLRLVQAMGKSCANSSFQYDPALPLEGLSPAMASFHGSLKHMERWLTELPPDMTAHARFGNPVFKLWHERLTARTKSIVQTMMDCCRDHASSNHYSAAVLEECSTRGFDAAAQGEMEACKDDAVVTELAAYLRDAFGHPVRLDFGTGHESSIMVFLFAVCKLGCFGNDAHEPPSMDRLKATCLSIFSQYLKVTRGIQTDYMLEPAGSHGVWGLDDYHCLPFYFGACQLAGLEDYPPDSIHNTALLERHGEEFLYFGCIRYIRSLKKGVPFFESSPMLNDISAIPTWTKVSSGLLKLYEGEVLSKRQVVQHFVFGSLFKATWTPSQDGTREAPTETFRGVPPMVRAPWAT
jgi:hypothetical protein